MSLVSVSTEVMDSVLEKLACLMSDESTKLIGVRKQLQFLHDELSSMHAFLDDADGTEGPSSKQTTVRRNEVRELTYEIEDCIDDFRHRVEGPYQRQGLIRKAVHLLETLMARYQIATKIKELRTRVQETSDRHTRYRPDECMSRPANVAVDARITALYAQTSSLVGIDGPKEEIIKLLTKVDDMPEQGLKVVSIVGFGGLGKTTLANEVYRRLGEGFSCRAFISVSQRPDMMTLLKKLLTKVSGREVDHTYDLQDLIDNLRGYLEVKRYFLVIDDIWDASAWEIIRCAFPESHCGSRVLTTTRIESVAVACCSYQWQFVYKMKTLDDNNSRQLFYGRVFGLGSACLEAFKEPGEKILRKCGGLPLAIITVASLLASLPTRSIEPWNYVLDSMRHNLGSNSTLEGMRQILDLSYSHLPCHLKSCLLYIGMYPEDYEIERDDLVMQCVAEGFISGVDGALAVGVAGSYLNELVNRSLIIQVVRHGARGEHLYYKVHDMVLDLILHKTIDENFLSSAQNLEALKTTKQQYKSRRLSLQFNDTSPVETAVRIGLPHVRSLIIIGWPLGNLGLLELKFLRVLFIQLVVNLDLTLVGKLFQLRYLCIRRQTWDPIRLQLPREISGLWHLETLIIHAGLPVVPQDIVFLPALSHLLLPLTTAYPDRIGVMKSLQTLRQFDPSRQSLENIRDLGELINLRVLELLISDVSFISKGIHMDTLMSSLEKLINCRLRNLSITAGDSMGYHSKWSSLCISSCHLEELHLYFRFPTRIPVWVYQLATLSSLKIKVAELCKDDIAALAGLPILARLFILDCGIVPGEGVVFSSDATFKVLNYIRVHYVAETGITFQAGSMPQVETIRLLLKADDMKQHGVKLVGIEHLPNLKKVHIHLRRGSSDESDIPAVKAAIKSVFDAHPARSAIQIEYD